LHVDLPQHGVDRDEPEHSVDRLRVLLVSHGPILSPRPPDRVYPFG
jgi:hypothetical protein